MYNQIEAILSQYEMKIYEVVKGRGSYICDTDKGQKLLVSFRGSKEKGEFLCAFLKDIQRCGFSVEQIERNKQGEAVSVDEVTGDHFLVKDGVSGTELNTGRLDELRAAVTLLAEYHNVAGKTEIIVPERIKENAATIVEVRRRHYREIAKVKNYIRGRKKKNAFEQMFMRVYENMMHTAEKSIQILEEEEEKNPQSLICHGDYNQHNVIFLEGHWRIVHYENFFYGWPVLDLANFLRKMLEKNNWDVALGEDLIRAYDQVYPLGDNGMQQLCGILLFPEKFWKISNHYMNSRKSWISERDMEKLKKVIEQETARLFFVENLFSIPK